ncbi:MAG: SAM-dependent methyltransferase [Clostridia bacterium]|nr:SAM-dependent methyltransferase [Clostridia bacterium]
MQKILTELQNRNSLIKIILSDTKTAEFKKIIIRPILIKNNLFWQFEKHTQNKVYHENIQDVEFLELIKLVLQEYMQIAFFYTGYTVTFSGSKGKYTKSQSSNNLKEITILDFGCGKSYLTFIIYHYFVYIKKIKATVIGYDLKEDVVQNCNAIALRYGYENLKFYVNDVTKGNLYNKPIDMIITLHACDIATDYALDYAIKNNVPFIFSVPCCQHEINQQIRSNGDFDILLKHGLIKERFCALLTDSIRAEILSQNGYSVDLLEFVDFAHSPKNIMIRANKTTRKIINFDIQTLCDKYNFKQTLWQLQKNPKN